MSDNTAKARSHASWEGMSKNENVRAKIQDVNDKAKRKKRKAVDIAGEETTIQRMKGDRDERRSLLLGMEAYGEKIDTFREKKNRIIFRSCLK